MAYDFLFFWLHLAMHCWPWFGRLLDHARHHDRDDTGGSVQAQGSAFRTVRHSFVDGALQVFVNICVQRHTVWGSPKSRLARWLHNILVTMLLSEVRMQPRASRSRGSYRRICLQAHSTGSLRIARRLPVALVGGVHEHHLHHRHRGLPFQQFFSYLDDHVASRFVRLRQKPSNIFSC